MQIKSISIMLAALLLAGCGSGGGSTSSQEAVAKTGKAVQAEDAATDWYVRLVAEDPARGLKTQSTQLGALDNPAAVETYSLPAMAPLASSYVDIVFENPEGLSTNEYKSSFHVSQDGVSDGWRFTVKTDDSQSEVVLTWHGLYVLEPYVDSAGRTQYKEHRSVTNPLLKKMQIVDETTGETYPAVSGNATPSFRVRMNGSLTRTFRWELLTTDSNATVSTPVSVATVALRNAALVSKSTFDLQHPPVFDETE